MGSPVKTGAHAAPMFASLYLVSGALFAALYLASGVAAGVDHGPVHAQDCAKLERCKGDKNCEFQLVLALSRDPDLISACKLTFNCTRNTNHPLCPQVPDDCSLTPNHPLCSSQTLVEENLCSSDKLAHKSSKIIFTEVDEPPQPENCREFKRCHGNCSCVLMIILTLSSQPGRLEECLNLVDCRATPENPLCPFIQAEARSRQARASLVLAHHGPVNATTCQDNNIRRRCRDKQNHKQCLLQVLLFLSEFPEMLEDCKRLADCREFSTNPLCPLLEQEVLDSEEEELDVEEGIQCSERRKRSPDDEVIIHNNGDVVVTNHAGETTCEKLIKCDGDSACLLDLVLVGAVDISQVESCTSVLNCSTSSQDNPLYAILCPDLETPCEDIVGRCDEVVTCNKECGPGSKGVCCCNICPLCDQNDPDQKRCTDNPQAVVANFDIVYTDELFSSLCEESVDCSYCCQPGKLGACLCNNCELCSETPTAPFICTADPAAAKVDLDTPCDEMERDGKCDNVTVCSYSCNEKKQGVCCCDVCPSCDESRQAMCRGDPCLGPSPPPECRDPCLGPSPPAECRDPCLGPSPPPECLTTVVEPPTVFSGCPAAMKCISPTRCKIHKNGLTSISEHDVSTDITAISAYKTINRCKLLSEKDGVGLCCLDPNYVDPWPCGMDEDVKCVNPELCSANGIIIQVPDPSGATPKRLTTLKKCENVAMGVSSGVCCREDANVDSGLLAFPEDIEDDLLIPQFLTVVSQLQKSNRNNNQMRKGKATKFEKEFKVKRQRKFKSKKNLQRKAKENSKENESFENLLDKIDASNNEDCNDVNCRKFVPPRTSIKICPKHSQCRTKCAKGETSISPKMRCIVSGQRKLGQCCEEN